MPHHHPMSTKRILVVYTITLEGRLPSTRRNPKGRFSFSFLTTLTWWWGNEKGGGDDAEPSSAVLFSSYFMFVVLSFFFFLWCDNSLLLYYYFYIMLNTLLIESSSVIIIVVHCWQFYFTINISHLLQQFLILITSLPHVGRLKWSKSQFLPGRFV